MKNIFKIFTPSIMILIFIYLIGCSDTAPYGAKVIMPADVTIAGSGSILFRINAIVVDEDDNPLNGMDIQFLYACPATTCTLYKNTTSNTPGSSVALPYNTNTDASGVATVWAEVGPSYGDYLISADIGVASDQTAITFSST